MIVIHSQQLCFGGKLGHYTHQSKELGLAANFSVFIPENASKEALVPVIYLLAGLTCTEETFLIKSNVVRFAASHGLALVAPDTSPRGAGVAGEDDGYDLGTGAGFYLDATEQPWATNYRMGSYLSQELPEIVKAWFPVDDNRRGIMGHSMGGHGALVHGLTAPDKWKSISAFSPIVHPSVVPWGEKAFSTYLGTDRATWAAWDATSLLEAGKRHPATILIDQGQADQFLEDQLKPQYLELAAEKTGQPLVLRHQAGYDHSYWFIQTFIEDHLKHHASILRK